MLSNDLRLYIIRFDPKHNKKSDEEIINANDSIALANGYKSLETHIFNLDSIKVNLDLMVKAINYSDLLCNFLQEKLVQEHKMPNFIYQILEKQSIQNILLNPNFNINNNRFYKYLLQCSLETEVINNTRASEQVQNYYQNVILKAENSKLLLSILDNVDIVKQITTTSLKFFNKILHSLDNLENSSGLEDKRIKKIFSLLLANTNGICETLFNKESKLTIRTPIIITIILNNQNFQTNILEEGDDYVKKYFLAHALKKTPIELANLKQLQQTKDQNFLYRLTQENQLEYQDYLLKAKNYNLFIALLSDDKFRQIVFVNNFNFIQRVIADSKNKFRLNTKNPELFNLFNYELIKNQLLSIRQQFIMNEEKMQILASHPQIINVLLNQPNLFKEQLDILLKNEKFVATIIDNSSANVVNKLMFLKTYKAIIPNYDYCSTLILKNYINIIINYDTVENNINNQNLIKAFGIEYIDNNSTIVKNFFTDNLLSLLFKTNNIFIESYFDQNQQQIENCLFELKNINILFLNINNKYIKKFFENPQINMNEFISNNINFILNKLDYKLFIEYITAYPQYTTILFNKKPELLLKFYKIESIKYFWQDKQQFLFNILKENAKVVFDNYSKEPIAGCLKNIEFMTDLVSNNIEIAFDQLKTPFFKDFYSENKTIALIILNKFLEQFDNIYNSANKSNVDLKNKFILTNHNANFLQYIEVAIILLDKYKDSLTQQQFEKLRNYINAEILIKSQNDLKSEVLSTLKYLYDYDNDKATEEYLNNFFINNLHFISSQSKNLFINKYFSQNRQSFNTELVYHINDIFKYLKYRENMDFYLLVYKNCSLVILDACFTLFSVQKQYEEMKKEFINKDPQTLQKTELAKYEEYQKLNRQMLFITSLNDFPLKKYHADFQYCAPFIKMLLLKEKNTFEQNKLLALTNYLDIEINKYLGNTIEPALFNKVESLYEFDPKIAKYIDLIIMNNPTILISNSYSDIPFLTLYKNKYPNKINEVLLNNAKFLINLISNEEAKIESLLPELYKSPKHQSLEYQANNSKIFVKYIKEFRQAIDLVDEYKKDKKTNINLLFKIPENIFLIDYIRANNYNIFFDNPSLLEKYPSHSVVIEYKNIVKEQNINHTDNLITILENYFANDVAKYLATETVHENIVPFVNKNSDNLLQIFQMHSEQFILNCYKPIVRHILIKEPEITRYVFENNIDIVLNNFDQRFIQNYCLFTRSLAKQVLERALNIVNLKEIKLSSLEAIQNFIQQDLIKDIIQGSNLEQLSGRLGFALNDWPSLQDMRYANK